MDNGVMAPEGWCPSFIHLPFGINDESPLDYLVVIDVEIHFC